MWRRQGNSLLAEAEGVDEAAEASAPLEAVQVTTSTQQLCLVRVSLYNFTVPSGFRPEEFPVAVAFLAGESQLQQSRATQPSVHAGCFSVSIIQRTLTWTTGSLTCMCDLFVFICYFFPLLFSPQWGAADAGIKVPSSENAEPKRSSFQFWTG